MLENKSEPNTISVHFQTSIASRYENSKTLSFTGIFREDVCTKIMIFSEFLLMHENPNDTPRASDDGRGCCVPQLKVCSLRSLLIS